MACRTNFPSFPLHPALLTCTCATLTGAVSRVESSSLGHLRLGNAPSLRTSSKVWTWPRPFQLRVLSFSDSWLTGRVLCWRTGKSAGKMMSPEPLRSAMVNDVGEDTSLALPSDNGLSTGQQRVLTQVNTIKRSKFKQSKKIISPPPSSRKTAQSVRPSCLSDVRMTIFTFRALSWFAWVENCVTERFRNARLVYLRFYDVLSLN